MHKHPAEEFRDDRDSCTWVAFALAGTTYAVVLQSRFPPSAIQHLEQAIHALAENIVVASNEYLARRIPHSMPPGQVLQQCVGMAVIGGIWARRGHAQLEVELLDDLPDRP